MSKVTDYAALNEKNARMQKLMGDEGWGGGSLFFSTDPKCLWSNGNVRVTVGIEYFSRWNLYTWRRCWLRFFYQSAG